MRLIFSDLLFFHSCQSCLSLLPLLLRVDGASCLTCRPSDHDSDVDEEAAIEEARRKRQAILSRYR